MTLLRTWAVLAITWVVAVLCIRLLILDGFVLDRHTVTALIAVPLVQAVVMAGVFVWRRRAS